MWGVWEWWTSEVTGLGYFPFVCLQASYVGLFLLVARRLHRLFPRIPLALVIPTIWTGVELFRGEIVLDGYAWGLLAHPLIAVTALASPAALLGTYFVSFLAAALNGAIGDFALTKRRTAAAIAAGCCAAAWVAGAICLPPIDPATQKVRPAIVQTNVASSNKTNRTPETELEEWKELKAMTLDVAGEQAPASQRPDFGLWPETMVPGRTIEPDAVRENDEHESFITRRTMAGGSMTILSPTTSINSSGTSLCRWSSERSLFLIFMFPRRITTSSWLTGLSTTASTSSTPERYNSRGTTRSA